MWTYVPMSLCGEKEYELQRPIFNASTAFNSEISNKLRYLVEEQPSSRSSWPVK
jgi:hypothetical protein